MLGCDEKSICRQWFPEYCVLKLAERPEKKEYQWYCLKNKVDYRQHYWWAISNLIEHQYLYIHKNNNHLKQDHRLQGTVRKKTFKSKYFWAFKQLRMEAFFSLLYHEISVFIGQKYLLGNISWYIYWEQIVHSSSRVLYDMCQLQLPESFKF